MRKAIVLQAVLVFALAGAANAGGPSSVNWADLAVFSNQWLAEANSVNSWCNGTDLDHSGGVNFADFSLFAQYWQKQSPAYYVAPYGNDNNPGTLMRPFKTIQKAANVMASGDTCYIRGGKYHGRVGIDKLVATASEPITFTNYNNEEVILAGTLPIETSWSVYSGNIYKTTISEDIWQLFVDGKCMTAARWPNVQKDWMEPDDSDGYSPTPGSYWDTSDTGTWGHLTSQSSWGHLYNDETVNSLAAEGKSFKGGIVHAYSCLVYINTFFAEQITQHTAGAGDFQHTTFYYPAGSPTTVSPSAARYYIEAHLNCLDSPGEWFYDVSTGELYVWFEDSGTPEGRVIEGKNQDYVLSVTNSAHLNFQGLTLFGAAFQIKWDHDIKMENCRSLYSSYGKRMLHQLDPGGHPFGFPIYNITDRCSTPANISFINCEFAYAEGAGLIIRSKEGHLVENCHFYNCCWGKTFLSCVSDAKGSGTTYRRNTFHTLGITCAYKAGSNALFEYNRAYDLHFPGDFSTYQIPQATQHTAVIHHTWAIDGHDRNGLRFDGDPAGIRALIHHFVSKKNMRGFRMKGDQHQMYNLTGIDNGHKVDLNIAHEKFYGYDPPDCLEYECRIMGRRGSHPYHGNELTIAHNLAADSITNWPLTILDPCDKTGIWHGNALGKKLRDQLRDPDNLDFRPCEGSELIDAGTHVPGITDGYIGEAPDIGAYEYGDTNYWIPGCKFDKATCPIPPDGSDTVKTNADLMWLEGLDAVSHDVYFGTDPNSLIFKSNQSNNIFAPGTLTEGQTYYWRIDTVTESETITGDVWSFTVPAALPVTFYATDDAAITDGTTENKGTLNRMPIKQGTAYCGYIKFTVSGVEGNITGAKLWLKTRTVTGTDTTVYEVADNNWDEMTINGTNEPAMGTALDTLYNLETQTWYEFDVSAFVTANGTYSLGIQTTQGSWLDWQTKEGSNSHPELVVTYE